MTQGFFAGQYMEGLIWTATVFTFDKTESFFSFGSLVLVVTRPVKSLEPEPFI